MLKKHTLRDCLLILIISFLPFISIFTTNLSPHTQDGLVHLARMAAYFKTLRDGEFPVRWAGYLNYGYGMPLFNFIYQLPYFISSFLIFLGTSLVNSYKIVLTVSFLLSGIFAYLFAKELFGDRKKIWIFTLFYQFAPFRLVELLVRGDIGEIYTYTFLPLVCYGLLRLSKKQSLGNITLVSLATALLVLSHNSISLCFFAVACGFVFITTFNKKSLLYSFGSLIFGLFLSMFYWLPALAEHKYTFGDLFMKSLYLQHFANIQLFFIPNFFNSPGLRIGGVPVQIGLFHILAIFVALGILFTKKIQVQEKKVFLFAFLLILISFFFMQPISRIVWMHVSLLRQFQFPWRFVSVIVFATALLSVSFVDFFVEKIELMLLLVLVVFSTISFWQPTYGWDKVNEKYYWNYPLTSTYYGETDVIWTQGEAKSFPKSPVAFAAGKGEISNFWRNSYEQTFIVDAKDASTVVSYTEYFPGWKVYVNNQQVPIQFQDENYRGQITFPVQKGKSTVKVIFGETLVRLFSDIVSLLSMISLLLIVLYKRIFRHG